MKKIKSIAISLDQTLVFVIYLLITIAATLILSHQQLIVGTIINSLLFFTSHRVDHRYHLPIAIFPSVLAVFQGLLFGSFTVFLLYFLPAIWIANYLLIKVSQKNHWLLSIISKVALLYIYTLILVNLKIVPSIFLTAMGGLQLITAGLGLGLYLIINRLLNNHYND